MKPIYKGLGLVVLTGCVVLISAQTYQPTWGTQPEREKIANILVTECARIDPNDLVLITGGLRDFDLLENLAVETRRLGAHPFISIHSEDLDRRFFTDVPKQFDTQSPAFNMKLANLINTHIAIDYKDRPDAFSDIDPERLADRNSAAAEVEKKMLDRAVRQVYLGNGLYPTEALARQFEIPQTTLAKIFWDAINVNYGRMQETGQRVRQQIMNGETLTISAPNGTQLTMKIKTRPVFVSDGVISTADREPGNPNCQAWLPAGEVYITPVPATAEGTFVADNFFYEGKLFRDFRLEFQRGRLVNMTAKEGDLRLLRQRYDASPSGRDILGTVDVGINPNIDIPRNSRMVTWMAEGTISVIVGNNVWAGGDNEVPFWLPVHLTEGTLKVDDKTIVENGKLAIR